MVVSVGPYTLITGPNVDSSASNLAEDASPPTKQVQWTLNSASNSARHILGVA